MSKKIDKKVNEILINSIRNTKSDNELKDFLNDLLSPAEFLMISKRLSVAFMILEDKYTYEDIIKTLKVSDGTVSKIHSILILQGKGFRKTLGDILIKKTVRNSLSEFLDLITPNKRTLTGEVYEETKLESKRKRDEPL